MCYSTSNRKKREEIEERVNSKFKIPLSYEPYYYQSAFNHQNLYIIKQDEPEIVPSVWGLVPNFALKDPQEFLKKNYTNNARSETLFEKSSFKHSAPNKRCLILADGFFEPHHKNKVAYPYFCHYKNDSLFAFAGIYNELDKASDLYSCTIITVEANEQFAEVHNKKKRMPLVLDEEFESEWLRNDLEEPHIKELMRVGFTTEEFECYPVTKDLYKPKAERNTMAAITKVDYPELNEQQSLF